MNKKDFELLSWNYKRYLSGYGYSDIYQAYKNPSSAKRAIWENIKKWFEKNGGSCRIISRNSMIFTVCGEIVDNETGEIYAVYITKAYTRTAAAAEIIREYKAA